MGDAAVRLALRVGYLGFLAYAFLVRPRVLGAAVLVRWQGGILLIRNSYRRDYGVPGGGMRRGETPIQTALRELREEAGLCARPEELQPLGELVVRHSWMEDHVHFFELHCEREPALRIDRREVIWAGFRSPEAARGLALWPPLRTLLHGGAAPGP